MVTAARQALDKENVNLILPYVKENASADVKSAFEKALRARKADPAAREVAEVVCAPWGGATFSFYPDKVSAP